MTVEKIAPCQLEVSLFKSAHALRGKMDASESVFVCDASSGSAKVSRNRIDVAIHLGRDGLVAGGHHVSVVDADHRTPICWS